MSIFELSLSPDYAREWTLVDAVRELFQNALDQERVQEDNKMYYEWDFANDTLQIGNRHSVLEAKSLLLGATTKAGDKQTIGQFGEGYKIATLVLLRLGKKIVFHNYGKKEIWTPRFVDSRRYGAKILVFDVKKAKWDKIPNHDLVITIDGIDAATYQDIVDSNLNMQPSSPSIETSEGRILLDEKYAGKIFVSGLYVTTQKQLHMGYDFLPKYLPLGRDRNMVTAIDVAWETSKMWQECGGDLMLELAKKDAADVQYVSNTRVTNTQLPEVTTKAQEDFVQAYGEKAVPVTTQMEADIITTRYKDAEPIIVNATHNYVLTGGDSYIPAGATEREKELPTISNKEEKLLEWLNKYQDSLSEDEIDELIEIIDYADVENIFRRK